MQKTLKEIIRETKNKLLNIYTQNSQAEITAYWIIEHVTGYSQAKIILKQDKIISEETKKKIEDILNLILNRDMPIQYIFGQTPYLDLNIKVKAPILIPRPETEYWTQEIINKFKDFKESNLKILDLCTGTGCIALSFAKFFKKSHIWALDINPKACELTIENAKNNDINNITILNSDLFENLNNIKFDLILSNPPYISQRDWEKLDTSVKNWEDKIALVSNNNGLELTSKIIKESKKWLIYNKKITELNLPQLILEIGHDQAQDIIKIFQENKFIDIKVHKDLFLKDRFITGGVCHGDIF